MGFWCYPGRTADSATFRLVSPSRNTSRQNQCNTNYGGILLVLLFKIKINRCAILGVAFFSEDLTSFRSIFDLRKSNNHSFNLQFGCRNKILHIIDFLDGFLRRSHTFRTVGRVQRIAFVALFFSAFLLMVSMW